MTRLARVAGEFLGAFWWLSVIEISLRVSGLPATCRRLGVTLDVSSGSVPSSAPAALSGRSRRAVRVARLLIAHWPGGDTCLRRCLLIGQRLRLLGPVLRIGVRRHAGAFSAHSWLEFGGMTLDAGAVHFATLSAVDREESR